MAKIIFKGEKQNGNEITICFVNDLIMNTKIQEIAAINIDNKILKLDEKLASGYFHFFEKIAKYIQFSDAGFVNLETPLGENLAPIPKHDRNGRYITEEKKVSSEILYDSYVYGCFSKNFNTHPCFALALKKTGFNIVNTANNHPVDRLSNGIDKTIETLDKYDIAHFGSIEYKKTLEKNFKNTWDVKPYIVKNIKGIKIAFMGGTQFLNWNLLGDGYFKKPDEHKQIYRIGTDSFFTRFNGKNIKHLIKWIKHAKTEGKADIVIIYLHFGLNLFSKKNGHTPDFLQRSWAKKILEHGADIIIGGHSHTLQKAQKIVTKDKRETFVSYNLGNFLSYFQNPNKDAAVILYVTLVQNQDGVFIKKIQYLPTNSLAYKKNDEINDIQIIPVDKNKELEEKLKNHYIKIFDKENLTTTAELEKEFYIK